jgi:O-antigen ligase
MNNGWLNRASFALLWLFVFFIPVEKMPALEGLGPARLLGVAALGATLAVILVERRFRLPLPAHIALILFTLWSAFTLGWSVEPGGTLERVTTYVQLLLLVWLVWQNSRERIHVERLMQAFLFGCLWAAADTIRAYRAAQQVYYQRYAGAGLDPNDLALMLALSLPVAFYLSLRCQGATRWLYRLAMLFTTAVVMLTASRAGTAATLLAWTLPFFALRWMPRRERLALVGLAVALGLAALLVIPVSTWTRLATAAGEVRSGTLNSRTLLWGAGLHAVENVPLRGVGAGAYPESIASQVGRPRDFTPVAHNTFISVFVETGAIGFALFAGFLALMVWQLAHYAGLEARLWAVSLLVWFTGVSTLTWEHRKPTWLLFAILLAHIVAVGPRIQLSLRSVSR